MTIEKKASTSSKQWQKAIQVVKGTGKKLSFHGKKLTDYHFLHYSEAYQEQMHELTIAGDNIISTSVIEIIPVLKHRQSHYLLVVGEYHKLREVSLLNSIGLLVTIGEKYRSPTTYKVELGLKTIVFFKTPVSPLPLVGVQQINLRSTIALSSHNL